MMKTYARRLITGPVCKTVKRAKQHGQAIIMVTFALFVMLSMLGFVVDLGWAYFVRKAARGAADSAALGAIRKAFSTVGSSGPFTCSTPPCTPGTPCLVCQPAPTPCSSIAAGTNLLNGCQYAQQNGFTSGGNNGRQEVRLTANTTTPFNTATGPVSVQYWVTAEVVETVPLLFAAVMGNATTTVRATATAAIVNVVVPGSLILLNRQNDKTRIGGLAGGTQYGVNIDVQANDNQGLYALQTSAGIRMASECGPNIPLGQTTCSNGSNTWLFAGENQGGGTVYSPDTRIRGAGWYHLSNGSDWIQTPTNGHNSGFDDPMAGKGQPSPNWPAPTASLQDIPVLNGVVNSTLCAGGVCQPGKYYTVRDLNCGQGCTNRQATGEPLQISENIRFASPVSGFGNYVFYGGLRKAGNQVTVTFEPNVYVFAGALPDNGPGVLLQSNNNFTMVDNTASTGQNSDPGALFIFTNGTYGPNESSPLYITPPQTNWTLGFENSLQYGTVDLSSGNNNTVINLHGLNRTNALIAGTPLETFAPALFWWDQGNSSVKHTLSGNVDTTSCGSGHDINNPCTNTLADDRSPELKIKAAPSVNLYGSIYQPRGTWTSMIGGGGYSGPLQLITGAISVQGNSNVTLTVPNHTTMMTIASLIE